MSLFLSSWHIFRCIISMHVVELILVSRGPNVAAEFCRGEIDLSMILTSIEL